MTVVSIFVRISSSTFIMGPGLTTGVLLLLPIIAPANAASFSIFCDAERGFEVEEGKYDTIWSYRSSSTSNVTWTVRSPNGKVTELGSCRGKTCSSPLAPDIVIDPRVYSPSKSDLDIVSMKREYAGELIFTETYDGVEETANCTLNAYTRAVVSNCNAQIHKSNWSAVCTCDVKNAYSSADVYEYSLVLYWETNLKPEYSSQEHVIAYAEVSSNHTRFFPTPYTNLTDGKTYYKDKITYSVFLPKYDGTHAFQTKIYPGQESDTWFLDEYINITTFSFGAFPIQNPDLPTHNCKDLKYIPENGDVPCVCSTESVGLPEGRLIWFSGDTVLVAGGYGVTQLQFPSYKVDRRDDGMEKKCQLDWVVKREIPVTNSVAYGPDIVELHYWEVRGTNGTRVFVVRCSPQRVNPMTSDMIQWGGLCQGQTGFTCILAGSAYNGNSVTCRATNTANNAYSAHASITIAALPPARNKHPLPVSNNPELMKGVAVGCGAALGVLMIAIGVTVFVLWKRGYRFPSLPRTSPIYDVPDTRRQANESSDYTDLSYYEVPVVRPPVEGCEYRNTTELAAQPDIRVYENPGSDVREEA